MIKNRTYAKEWLVDLIVEMASFGLEHTKHDDLEDGCLREYSVGGVESVSHMIACCIAQWFVDEGVPTSDVCDALKLDEYPNRKKLKKRLMKFINETDWEDAK